MLGVFSSEIEAAPEALVAARNRTPSSKKTAQDLIKHSAASYSCLVTMQIGDQVHLAYSHQNQSPLLPRSFGVKDGIFCLFEGILDNLGSLRQEYGLPKSADEDLLLIEAYKALRDRAPFPPSRMVGHLNGSFAFVIFDNRTSTLFVASDRFGKASLSLGVTADGFLAFADDAQLLEGACGRSLAAFPHGCFFSTSIGELRSYESPKDTIISVPASDEEIWGVKFKVEGPAILAATE